MVLWNGSLVAVAGIVFGCGPDSNGASNGGASDAGTPATNGSGASLDAGDSVDETGADAPSAMPRECDALTLEASRQAWEQLRSDAGDTYYIQARRRDQGREGTPVEMGCSYVFTLQFVAGAATSLAMVPSAFGGEDIAVCDPGWVEDEASLGSHSAPLQPWTMGFAPMDAAPGPKATSPASSCGTSASAWPRADAGGTPEALKLGPFAMLIRAVSCPDEIAQALHAARPPPPPRGQLALFVF